MSNEIKAPVFPESVADGTIATWHKQVGEQVKRDELLVDIETDKVVLEVVAQADGVLKEIIKPEGETILSAEVIAIFEAGGVGDSAPAQPAADSSADESADAEADDVKVNPAARKLAEEKGVSLSDVKATGKDGRITKEDVLNHLKAPAPQADAPQAPAESAPAQAPAKPAPAAAPSFNPGERAEKRVPMTRLQNVWYLRSKMQPC